MAKLRTARAYRRIKRPLTKHSKLRALDYVKGAPYPKVAQYDMGELSKKFPFELQVIAAVSTQLRDTAIEAGRQAAIRHLDLFAKGGWAMKVRAVPHHILREKLDFIKEAARKAITKLPVHCQVKVFDLASSKEVTF